MGKNKIASLMLLAFAGFIVALALAGCGSGDGSSIRATATALAAPNAPQPEQPVEAPAIEQPADVAAAPIAMWALAALNVAAPMFVISGSATAMSILRNHEAQPRKRPAIDAATDAPAHDTERVTVRKRAPAQLPDAQAFDTSAPQAIAQPDNSRAIDRNRLAGELSANPQMTSAALAQLFGVSASAIRATDEWRNRKGA